MTSVEEKQSLMELPPSEKVVAVALKYIFDEIRKIEKAETEEITAVQIALNAKFRALEDKVNSIVNGTILTAEDLANKEKYFTATELPDVDQVAQSAKGIENFWFTTFKNSFGESMVDQDNVIGLALLKCASNSYEDRIEIDFTFADNEHFAAGNYNRKFILINSVPQGVQGDEPVWIGDKPEGIFGRLLTNYSIPGPLLSEIFNDCTDIINDVIPNSLVYFLGAVMEDEEGEEEEGEDEEEDDVSDQPNKIIKQ